LLFTYKQEILVGFLVTFIFACLNLLVPQLIRSFLTDMQGYGLKKIRVSTSSYFAQQFVVLQFLRLIFGEHSKRLFNEMAIKVESTLSKRLIEKSLRMARECTDRIPQSEIYQLENVDLKLIFNLFKNLHLIFEAPVTVVGALFLIFLESPSYGMIAIYWFIIAFFLQRELDGRMSHCNQTKLKLIDKRSQSNY
jgi:ABC-type multidrug transport system fused ATPase/permease subunit